MGCVKLHILDEQYKKPQMWISSSKKELTTNFCAENVRKFYVSGVPWSEGFGSGFGANNYKFQGKEFIEMHGLDMHDFHARLYCQFTMRTTTIDPLAELRPWESPYSFFGNNPVNRIDPTGMIWQVFGDEEAQKAYLQMLYNSTGNHYKLDGNTLVLVGADANFKGAKSETLINVIQQGIDSKEIYTLNLVGARGDDHNVFIDSYSNRQIDISDLKLVGETSTALQGALVGHFLNEVQVPGGFEVAHAASLLVEGRIFGELVGDPTITTRVCHTSNINENGHTIIFQYGSRHRFELVQGVRFAGYTPYNIGGHIFNSPSYDPTGALKSVRRIRR